MNKVKVNEHCYYFQKGNCIKNDECKFQHYQQNMSDKLLQKNIFLTGYRSSQQQNIQILTRNQEHRNQSQIIPTFGLQQDFNCISDKEKNINTVRMDKQVINNKQYNQQPFLLAQKSSYQSTEKKNFLSNNIEKYQPMCFLKQHGNQQLCKFFESSTNQKLAKKQCEDCKRSLCLYQIYSKNQECPYQNKNKQCSEYHVQDLTQRANLQNNPMTVFVYYYKLLTCNQTEKPKKLQTIYKSLCHHLNDGQLNLQHLVSDTIVIIDIIDSADIIISNLKAIVQKIKCTATQQNSRFKINFYIYLFQNNSFLEFSDKMETNFQVNLEMILQQCKKNSTQFLSSNYEQRMIDYLKRMIDLKWESQRKSIYIISEDINQDDTIQTGCKQQQNMPFEIIKKLIMRYQFHKLNLQFLKWNVNKQEDREQYYSKVQEQLDIQEISSVKQLKSVLKVNQLNWLSKENEHLCEKEIELSMKLQDQVEIKQLEELSDSQMSRVSAEQKSNILNNINSILEMNVKKSYNIKSVGLLKQNFIKWSDIYYFSQTIKKEHDIIILSKDKHIPITDNKAYYYSIDKTIEKPFIAKQMMIYNTYQSQFDYLTHLMNNQAIFLFLLARFNKYIGLFLDSQSQIPYYLESFLAYNGNNCFLIQQQLTQVNSLKVQSISQQQEEDDLYQVLECLSHFSFFYSLGNILINDFKGQRNIISSYSMHFLSSMPHNETNHRNNHGYLGILNFFKSHQCNIYCHQMSLIHPQYHIDPSFNYKKILIKKFNKQFSHFYDNPNFLVWDKSTCVNCLATFYKQKEYNSLPKLVNFCSKCIQLSQQIEIIKIKCISCPHVSKIQPFLLDIKFIDQPIKCKYCQKLDQIIEMIKYYKIQI